MTNSMLLPPPRQAWGTASAGPSGASPLVEWPTKKPDPSPRPLASTELREVELGPHKIRLCVATDPDVGYRASSNQTPVWFGYGETPEAAVENYMGVANAGYEYMREQGRELVAAV